MHQERWQRRLSRRALLGGAVLGSAGLAAAVLVGCEEDKGVFSRKEVEENKSFGKLPEVKTGELPKGWPNDLMPVPRGSVIIESVDVGNTLSVFFVTEGTISELVNIYKNVLEREKWLTEPNSLFAYNDEGGLQAQKHHETKFGLEPCIPLRTAYIKVRSRALQLRVATGIIAQRLQQVMTKDSHLSVTLDVTKSWAEC